MRLYPQSLITFHVPEPADKLLSSCRCCAFVRRPRKSAVPSGCQFSSRTNGTNNRTPRRRPCQQEILRRLLAQIIFRLSRHEGELLQRTRLRSRFARLVARISPCNSVSRNLSCSRISS